MGFQSRCVPDTVDDVVDVDVILSQTDLEPGQNLGVEKLQKMETTLYASVHSLATLEFFL